MSKFSDGQEVWSKSLNVRVVIVYTPGGYAYVRDEDGNSYAVKESDLRQLKGDE